MKVNGQSPYFISIKTWQERQRRCPGAEQGTVAEPSGGVMATPGSPMCYKDQDLRKNVEREDPTYTKPHPWGKVAGSPKNCGKSCPHRRSSYRSSTSGGTKDDTSVREDLPSLQPQREGQPGEEEEMTVSTTAKKGEEAKIHRMRGDSPTTGRPGKPPKGMGWGLYW